MNKLIVTFFFFVFLIINAQSIDYNTKKGYAINGYDAVSYFHDKPQLGNEKFKTVYDGVEYKFSNQENLDKFNAKPIKYIPKYGGYCAYAVAVAGKKVSVNPKTYEIRNGKLYLFYNSWGNNTLESWIGESPDELVSMANKNWENIKHK